MILKNILLSCLIAVSMLTYGADGPGTLFGSVTDATTGEMLPYVNIRIENTSMGTVTDRNGNYILKLQPGEYNIVFSMVGYQTVKQKIIITGMDQPLDVKLAVSPYELEEVVVSGDGPGAAIMRAAIARKQEQEKRIADYTYMLYTKFTVGTDTSFAGRTSGRGDSTIVSIFESYSKGYYKAPDQYYNEIIQRRQSVNIPPQANFVAFGTNLNAYDNYITILNEEIATPFHPNALDYYEFELLGRYKPSDDQSIAHIRVTPKSSSRKLFSGFVDIEVYSAVPVRADLTPNRAVQLPFDAALTYRQSFDLFGDNIVMPAGLHIFTTLKAEIFWIIDPRLDITIATVAYDYTFNTGLDNELFEGRRVDITEQAEEFDSLYWQTNAVLPLKPEEEYAYDAIRRARENPDSALGANLADRIFGGIGRTISRLEREPFSGIDDVARYNRVHGFYLGLGFDFNPDKTVRLSLNSGYGFADQRPYGKIATLWKPDGKGHIQLEASAYKSLARRDNPYIYTTRGISLLSLLFKTDYGDYYYTDGVTLSAAVAGGQEIFIRRNIFVRPHIFKVSLLLEEQSPAGVNTNFSLLGGKKKFRDNPTVMQGSMRSVGFAWHYDYSPYRRISDFGFMIRGEYSSPDLLKSDFSFRQIEGTLSLRTPTLPLWTLDLRISGGYSDGDVPPQRFFSLESSANAVSAAGVFRGMNLKEYYGDRYVSASFEHNFGEVIPGVLRIPNIASFGIEFILTCSAGYTAFSDRTLQYTGTQLTTTATSKDRWYYEAGIGFNRILIFFRVDISARLSQVSSPVFQLTIGTATF